MDRAKISGSLKHSEINHPKKPVGVVSEETAWTYIFSHTNAAGARIYGCSQNTFSIYRSKFKSNKLGAIASAAFLKRFGFSRMFVHRDSQI